MAIQHRRGTKGYFRPEAMVAGEWAVVVSGDRSTSDGRAVYMCFEPGVVKRMATWEDMIAFLEEKNPYAFEALTAAVLTATTNANAATTKANTATTKANNAASRAEAAADSIAELEEGVEEAERNRVSAESARVTAETLREQDYATIHGDAVEATDAAREAADDATLAAAQARGAVSANLRFSIDVQDIDGARRLVLADAGEE